MSESNALGDQSLARPLFVALVAPLALLVVLGVVLAVQVSRLNDRNHWVDHTMQVISTVQEAGRLIAERESSLRGYLLTGDPASTRATFAAADPELLIDRTLQLVRDNPLQTERAQLLDKQYGRWLELARGVMTGDAETGRKDIAGLLRRREQMDGVRTTVAQMIATENDMLARRVEAATEADRTSRWITLALLLGVGGALAFLSRRQLATVASTFRSALDRERSAHAAVTAQEWISAGRLAVANSLRGELPVVQVAERVARVLVEYVGAAAGVFFVADGTGGLRRSAAHGAAGGQERFALGEGLVGRAAEKQELTRVRDLPPSYLEIRSGSGKTDAVEVLLLPIRVEGKLHAVLELGFLHATDERTRQLVEAIAEPAALALRSAEYVERLRELLEETQRQAEELEAQQEELRVSNEELAEHGQSLRAAHKQLEEQQSALEERNNDLAQQKSELLDAQARLNEKAAELARESRYKSEFLANMSHELRTPLNSALILAKLLSDNRQGNLTPQQVQYAETIYGAGNDLLAMINDVLDLAKIEAGRIDIRPGALQIGAMTEGLRRIFAPLADAKHLHFEVVVEPGTPQTIFTDRDRVEQVLRNLLSNAIKFTAAGRVVLTVSPRGDQVAFSVRDTGIGIAAEQHAMVFEPFRQADSSTSRKYGGTGLGLSISRDLARLLQGSIELESQPGAGSTFTLLLPRSLSTAPTAAAAPTNGVHADARTTQPLAPRPAPTSPGPLSDHRAPPTPTGRIPEGGVPDDRHDLKGHRTLLVIEDDPQFARIVYDLAHELRFQCVIASTSDEGFDLARQLTPAAIVLDMRLPDHPGLAVLDRLKRDPATRHIPVHVCSVDDRSREALEMGAVGYMLKPVERDKLASALTELADRFGDDRPRRVLLVEDDAVQREAIERLIAGDGVEVVSAKNGGEALPLLRSSTFDCMILDFNLPDLSGAQVLEKMASDESVAFPPVIVYTARSLSADEEQELRRYSNSIIIKGARSPERLLDEVSLFLHQVEAKLPAEQRRLLLKARARDEALEGRRLLVVEDDVRNVFALTNLLEGAGVNVEIARNGREALERLERQPPVDLVLMDIMMPEMDGITATRAIRARPETAKLPVIALTAKAMRDDQERCFAAGANDFVSKPIDAQKLMSIVRVWMPR